MSYKIFANKRRWLHVDLILAHVLRHWPNSKPTLVQSPVFAANIHLKQLDMLVNYDPLFLIKYANVISCTVNNL